jgi:hypothetical protein
VTLPQDKLKRGELPEKQCTVSEPRCSEYNHVYYFSSMVVIFFIYAWQVRGSACYHEGGAIFAMTV